MTLYHVLASGEWYEFSWLPPPYNRAGAIVPLGEGDDARVGVVLMVENGQTEGAEVKRDE